VVDQLLVAEGDTVEVGTAIITVAAEGEHRLTGPLSTPAQAAVGVEMQVAEGDEDEAPESGAVLVGYGTSGHAATRRSGRRPRKSPPVPSGGTSVLAKPPVRKLAKDLGVDITAVRPSGPGGVITREDVERARAPQTPSERVEQRPLVALRTGERETRIPIKGVRKATAEAMVASAFTAPHVTEWVTVDVTRTMKLLERLRADREFAGVKVSPLLVVAKALLLAVRRNPEINATWDAAAGEIVVKHYVNLGIAAATPRGLVVPNIKDADQLPLRQLADALAALTTTAREGRTPPADMSGGTITITNVGVFGVDAGTPILNPGEAAILAFGQVRRQPWVHTGKVRPRWVTQLALSFDHRLVDGDLGSRTLADLAAVLEDPSRALVWG
jgi:2-oxoisovalerate dehydrogenase E2 component (dihydrolipoyl transacylase)